MTYIKESTVHVWSMFYFATGPWKPCRAIMSHAIIRIDYNLFKTQIQYKDRISMWRDFQDKNKTALRPSYLYNGNSYSTDQTTWIRVMNVMTYFIVIHPDMSNSKWVTNHSFISIRVGTPFTRNMPDTRTWNLIHLATTLPYLKRQQ